MVDDRVPGAPMKELKRWVCPVCGRKVFSDLPPPCPADRTVMTAIPKKR